MACGLAHYPSTLWKFRGMRSLAQAEAYATEMMLADHLQLAPDIAETGSALRGDGDGVLDLDMADLRVEELGFELIERRRALRPEMQRNAVTRMHRDAHRSGGDVQVGIDATKPIGNDKVMSEMVHLGCEYPTDTVDLDAYIGRWPTRRAVAPGLIGGR